MDRPLIKISYDSKTCSRCGGSGRYSFIWQLGTLCRKCLGSGKEITSIGAKARKHFEEITTMSNSEIKAGYYMLVAPGLSTKKKWYEINEVRVKEEGKIEIVTNAITTLTLITGKERVVKSVEDLDKALLETREYQDKLLKKRTVKNV